ncbi:MAG TPA: dipeptidase [Flavobacteriaceae bacterium]|nr:dipeptidase [Flavobacteriaceae bacterium]
MKIFYAFTLLILVLISCNSKENKKDEMINNEETEIYKKAKEIHESVMTLDSHIDINTNNFTDSINYTQELKNQVNLPKMIKGGLDVAWFIVYTGQGELNEDGYENAYKEALAKFDAIHRLTTEIAPDQIALATSSKQAREIYNSGKKVAMIGVENGYPIGTNPERIKEFYNLGARYMSLAHNGHSQLCDSNTGEIEGQWLHNGLSELGKEVIAEMNKWGMMIDISHPSKEAIRQMVELSKAPIIASHSSSRALCNHSRNLDDEQLEWMKKNGGVVQAVSFGAYVDVEKNKNYRDASRIILNEIAEKENFKLLKWEEIKKLEKEERENYFNKYIEIKDFAKPRLVELSKTTPRVNVADYVNHIDYLVEKLGIDHVGISSDFDGGGGVEGWSDASETFNVTLELVKRGYTKTEIEKLWSKNLLRVLDEVQEVAKKIQVKV